MFFNLSLSNISSSLSFIHEPKRSFACCLRYSRIVTLKILHMTNLLQLVTHPQTNTREAISAREKQCQDNDQERCCDTSVVKVKGRMFGWKSTPSAKERELLFYIFHSVIEFGLVTLSNHFWQHAKMEMARSYNILLQKSSFIYSVQCHSKFQYAEYTPLIFKFS